MNVLPLPVRLFAASIALLSLSGRLEAKIGALGRVIPAGDILNLPGNGDAISEVHAKEGDVVGAGAPLLTFRSRQSAENEAAVAALALREAEELGQLSIETLTLKNEIAKRDFDFAKMRHDRFAEIGGETSSPQQMEQRRYLMKNAELAFQASSKDLERSKLDREIKIERATDQLAIARDKLERSQLKAPAKLTVVKIASVVGAIPGGAAVSLANLQEMHVVAEVFAGDLPKLKVGQIATITSTALPAAAKGRVISIGRLIAGRAKVAEVLIRLDEPGATAQLLNLEVNVSIDE